jgi:hypothetical protein
MLSLLIHEIGDIARTFRPRCVISQAGSFPICCRTATVLHGTLRGRTMASAIAYNRWHSTSFEKTGS